jgi:hypothetical protein
MGKIMCLRQQFKSNVVFRPDGWGDCSVCEADDNNQRCRGYIRVRTIFLEVTNEVCMQETQPENDGAESTAEALLVAEPA